MGDNNTGQVVQGNQTVNTIVLNVGGHPMPLVELTVEQLLSARFSALAGIKKRKRFLHFPRLLFTVLVLWAGAQFPHVLASAPATRSLSEPQQGVIIALVFLLSIITVVRINFGDWQARQKRTIRRLQESLSAIEAELDMRASPARNPFMRWCQELFESLRD